MFASVELTCIRRILHFAYHNALGCVLTEVDVGSEICVNRLVDSVHISSEPIQLCCCCERIFSVGIGLYEFAVNISADAAHTVYKVVRSAYGLILVGISAHVAHRCAVAVEVAHRIHRTVRVERHRMLVLAKRLIPYIIIAVVVHFVGSRTALQFFHRDERALISVHVEASLRGASVTIERACAVHANHIAGVVAVSNHRTASYPS